MPILHHNGLRLFWKMDGADEATPLVLLNSIGTDMDLWDAMLPALSKDYAIIRTDFRGHGGSGRGQTAPTLADLAQDVLAVLDAARIHKAAIAGVSLGGMVAMEMALAAPERVDRLALICTSAQLDEQAWRERGNIVRKSGMAAVTDMIMTRFLSAEHVERDPNIAATLRRQLLHMDPHAYADCAEAIAGMSLVERLPSLSCDTLVVTGSRDISTPFAGHGERLLCIISAARHVSLDVGHLAPIEAPAALHQLLCAFVRPMPNREGSAS